MQGGISTASPHATSAGIEALRDDGNAFDAAAAAAWALCVCEPSGSGLGGHTVALTLRPGHQIEVVNGRSVTPWAASLESITAAEQRYGRTASTVPSTVATLDFIQRNYGRLPNGRVLEPARRLAADGFRVSRLQQRESKWVADAIGKCGETASFFLPSGAPMREGELFRQPAIASTLGRLAEQGAEDFYQGSIAEAIVSDMTDRGGLIRAHDLSASVMPSFAEPLKGKYRGYGVITAPPPSGGLQLIRALHALEKAGPFHGRSVEWYAATAAAVQNAFRTREMDSYRWTAAEEPGETTHLSAADGEGNVVALTQSIQSLYGSKVAHPRLGFLYNNYVCTLTRCPGPYQLCGGLAPRSNASPTFVFRPGSEGGGLLMALGAAGSRRIISSLVQTISAVIDFNETIESAIAAPRIHGLLTGAVRIERPLAEEPITEALKQKFGRVVVRPALDFGMAAVQGLHFHTSGAIDGAADPRRDGVFERKETFKR